MKKILVALAGTLAIIVVGLLFVRPAAPAPTPQTTSAPKPSGQPQITWSTQALTFFLLPGDIRVRTVSFTASASLSQASIEAVPEISPVVKLTPVAISSLAAGQIETVQLQTSLPATPSSSSFNGTIHVREGSRTIPQPLAVVITIGVPLDPGPAGMATLAGIDSDGDGVRDDIQRYIAFTYPQSAKDRAALTQDALALEAQITGTSNYGQKVHDAGDCLGGTFMSSDSDVAGGAAALNADQSLTAIVLNTPARANAFFQADSRLGAAVIASTPWSQQASRCAINPLTFPN